MDRIITKDIFFLDEKGRVRLFSGYNIDDKLLDQTEFRYNLDDEFFKKFKANGFDIIRLAVTWQNLEPTMGKYNESYLKSIDKIFDLAEKYGVYILLDMHQDLYSGFDGKSVGDGAPSWAAITDGAKPKKPLFVWAEGYFWDKAVHKSFDHFWDNSPIAGKGVQDRFCDLWQMLADRYGDKAALLGYDLLNEPFPGSDTKRMFVCLIKGAAKEVFFGKEFNRLSFISSLLRLDIPKAFSNISGKMMANIARNVDAVAEKFDINKYSPFLNKTSSAIRDVSDKGIIMMEQSYIGNIGVKQSVPLITVNGKREGQQCFGPHSYDIAVDTPLYKYASTDRVISFFSEMRNTQLRLNVPVIVGEWGGCSDNSDTSWFPHAYDLMAYFDSNQWSQVYWDYHGDDLDKPVMKLLRRTHPVAVAGKIIRYGYDREKRTFTLEYESDGKNDTRIYVHNKFSMYKGESRDIKYRTVERYENGASLISVKAGEGLRKIVIHIEEK